MQKNARKRDVDAVLKKLGKTERYLSKIDGNRIIVVK